MSAPKISIITPCLNRSAFIADAVESVQAQECKDYEHIIVDGGSVDDTLMILAGYPHLVVYSEEDGGMYDAINKGISRSRGEIVGLLNSDDVYERGVFSEVIKEFHNHPEADVVTGMATYFQMNDGVKRIIKKLPVVTPGNFEYALMQGVPIINAWFFRRQVFEQLGPFDQKFFIAADRDFQARCLVNKITLRPVHRVFYHYRYHQDSMTVNSDLAKKEKYLMENLRLADKYAGANHEDKRLIKKFKNWKDLIVFELSITNLRRFNIKKSLEILFSAIKERPIRLVLYVIALPIGIIGFLYRLISKKIFR